MIADYEKTSDLPPLPASSACRPCSFLTRVFRLPGPHYPASLCCTSYPLASAIDRH